MKKFSAILICLLMIFTCSLAGCASFSINKVKYYNEVVAKVGNTNITRFELLSAYNSYGNSYYVSQLGQSDETALNNTLDLLIDREIMYQYGLENNDLYKPNAYQINEIVSSMFESLDSQMDEYVKTSKNIFNIKIEEEEETKSEEKTYLLKDYKYSPRAKVVDDNGVYKIEYIEQPEEDIENPLIDEDKFLSNDYLVGYDLNDIVTEIKTKYLAHFKQDLETNEKENATILENKAISLFTKSLMEYEYYLRDANGKAYSKNTNDLIYRYVERTFKSQIQSQYLTNIRNYYLADEDSELSIDLLLEEFTTLVDISYDMYNTQDEEEDYKNALKDIGTKGNDVLYHPELSDGTKFGYFLHTLISFDETQKSKIKATDSIPDKELAAKEKEILIGETKIQARDAKTGKIEENSEYVTLEQIINDFNSISGTYEEKLAQFINLMFQYTGDAESTLVSGMPYVIGHNYNTNTSYSGMVPEFTAEAVKLMKNDVKGSISNFSMDNISGMCVTEYGIHFLFYVGDVNSYDVDYNDVDSVYIQDKNKTANDDLNLFKKVLNPLTGETYFDMLFDKVYPADADMVYTSNTGYSEFEEDIISEKQNTVRKFETKIKSTTTKI